MLAVAGALSGCAAAPTVVHDHGRYAVVDGLEAAESDAAISGRLAVDVHGCWGLGSADGEFAAVVWPLGTNLVDGRISIPHSQAERVGDVVSGGGGTGPSRRAYPPCIRKGEEATYIDPGAH